MNRFTSLSLLAAVAFAGSCAMAAPMMNSNTDMQNYTLDYDTPVNPELQAQLEKIDTTLRAKYGLETNQTAIGLLDLRTMRLAMVRPDYELYAASVAKIGILLAYFQLHPALATNLDAHDTARTRFDGAGLPATRWRPNSRSRWV